MGSNAAKLKEVLVGVRAEFQSECGCFVKDDSRPASNHDLHVFAVALNNLLNTYEDLIIADLYDL